MLDNSGHRERVKKRFQEEGLAHFHPVHALELLLFYAIPRKDTKPIARKLLDYFGSFYGVLDAPPEALQRVEGVGANTAQYIRMMGQLVGYYMRDRAQGKGAFKSSGEIGRYISNFFIGARTEMLYLRSLDAKGARISEHKLCEGTVSFLTISPRKIAEEILAVGGQSVILAHNHPGGIPRFSDADVVATKRLAQWLSEMHITLLDHYLITEEDCISMAELGLYRCEEV